MSADSTSQPGSPSQSHGTADHRGILLGVVVTCQLMVVLDTTIVNIALPSIKDILHFSDTSLAWVLNAYTLTFGGLLLVGGRAGDILGRRRVFIAGIWLFTAASLLGGLAQTSLWLVVARALQGLGAALASPAVLAYISTSFEGPARARAMGIFGAVSGAGAAIGLIAGGVLTSWLSWRWVLFVNVPIGVVMAVLAAMYMTETERRPGRLDVAGALTSTIGVTGVVYGLIRAASNGWQDGITVGSLAAGVVFLVVFVIIEARAEQPVMPLRLLTDRNRSTSFVVRLLLIASMTGMFFFLTQFIQEVLGFSALLAAFSFLPIAVALFFSARVAPKLIPRFGLKRLSVAGVAITGLGVLWLSQISVTTTYLGGLVGPMVLMGVGMGLPLVTLTMIALSGVQPQDAGATSGLLNVMQQVGASVGLAFLVAVFGAASQSAAERPLAGASPELRAHDIMTRAIGTSFTVAAICIGAVFVLALVAIKIKPVAKGT